MAAEAELAACHGGTEERSISIIVDGMAAAALESCIAASRLEER